MRLSGTRFISGQGSALNNLAGALHAAAVSSTLSLGREVKMDIPANNFSHLYLATPSHRGWTRRGRNSVRRSRISVGLVLVLPIVAITLLWSYRIGSARSARTQIEASAKPVAPFQQLSSDGQGSLLAIIQAGNLSDLRWPDFSDY